jgi:hypothetical protein
MASVPLTVLSVAAIVLLSCAVSRTFRALLIPTSFDRASQAEAEAKGLQLLTENLTEAQRRQYRAQGCFDVVGCRTGKRYRIFHGTSGNVRELTEDGKLGVGRCFVPKGDLVACDCMLAQKIALENYEHEALLKARRF